MEITRHVHIARIVNEIRIINMGKSMARNRQGRGHASGTSPTIPHPADTLLMRTQGTFSKHPGLGAFGIGGFGVVRRVVGAGIISLTDERGLALST